MSSIGFSFAQIDVMRSKQMEKMKKMKEEEKEIRSKPGVKERKAMASLFIKMTKIHPNSPSPSKLNE
ncbi:hypothetical protein ACHQM5_023838 [Ranunculus cassubicifolius]